MTRRRRVPSLAALGIGVFAAIVLAALLADVIQPHDPTATQIGLRNRPPGTADPDGGLPFLLGTDPLGRDLLSRLLQGARMSLLIGLASVAVSGLIGISLGMFAGYYRGWVDELISRVLDLQMSLPSLLIALFVLFVLGTSVFNVVLVLAATRWMIYARVTRAMALSLREQLFVEAAVGLGASSRRILVRHMLPNLLGGLVVLSTLEVATMILIESSLSFLGLGLQPPLSSWGLMLSEGRQYMSSAWWLTAFPGIAILVTCLVLNALSGWMRNHVNPGGAMGTA